MDKLLWQKDARPADWANAFTVGEDYRWDRLLLPWDARASRVHAQGLHEAGVLGDDDWAALRRAFDALDAAIAAGEVSVEPEDEDGHTVIERFLTARAGAAGRKVHTGRSRNDQVLAALWLWLRDALAGAQATLGAIVEALCGLGERYDHAPMPGYTHLQQAMPSSAGQWALGYAEVLLDDRDALAAAGSALAACPLGSAAGYGLPHLDLPRAATARRLGFERHVVHPAAVQLMRGKVERRVLGALAEATATLNRMASDLVLFASSEFGFVRLPDDACTGSSIMPQKRNPDVLELVRAGHHRVMADLHVLQTLPANLPSGYHRDLQLTKEATMRGVGHARALLDAMARVVPEIAFRPQRMRETLSPGLFATARALEAVAEGVPFRDAYAAAAGQEGCVPEAPLAAYRAQGYPGQGRPDVLRERLAGRAAAASPSA